MGVARVVMGRVGGSSVSGRVSRALGVLGKRSSVGTRHGLGRNTGGVLADVVESVDRVVDLKVDAVVQVSVNGLHDDLDGSLLAVLEVSERQTGHAEVSSSELVDGSVQGLEVLLAIVARLGSTLVAKTQSVLSDGRGVRGLEQDIDRLAVDLESLTNLVQTSTGALSLGSVGVASPSGVVNSEVGVGSSQQSSKSKGGELHCVSECVSVCGESSGEIWILLYT